MLAYETFVKNFKNGKSVFLEDSVLWYALEYDTKYYLSLSINERINFKQSYFKTW